MNLADSVLRRVARLQEFMPIELPVVGAVVERVARRVGRPAPVYSQAGEMGAYEDTLSPDAFLARPMGYQTASLFEATAAEREDVAIRF